MTVPTQQPRLVVGADASVGGLDTFKQLRPDTALAVQDGRIELSMPTKHRKIGASRPFALPRATSRPTEKRDAEAVTADLPASPRRARGTDLARQAVLEAWVPRIAIAGEDGIVLFLHGEFGPYLRCPQGEKLRLEKNPCR